MASQAGAQAGNRGRSTVHGPGNLTIRRAAVEACRNNLEEPGLFEVIGAGEGLLREGAFTGFAVKALYPPAVSASGVEAMFSVGEGLTFLERMHAAFIPRAVTWFELSGGASFDCLFRPFHGPEIRQGMCQSCKHEILLLLERC